MRFKFARILFAGNLFRNKSLIRVDGSLGRPYNSRPQLIEIG